jgi:hypothetical protein
VNGHIEQHIDSRVMWGANGTDIILNEYHVNTSEKKEIEDGNVAIVEGNIEKPGSKDLLSTIEADLLEEGQLLAESILQSFSSSSSSLSTSNNLSLKSLPPPPPLSSSSSLLSNESYEDLGKELALIKAETNKLDSDSPSTAMTAVVVGSSEKEEEAAEQEDNNNDLHEWEELEYSYSIGWWKEIIPYGEEFILQWESDILSQLNDSLLTMIKNKISSRIIGEIKNFFIQQLGPLAAIKKSIGLPNLALAKIKELDDIWLIAMNRAK